MSPMAAPLAAEQIPPPVPVVTTAAPVVTTAPASGVVHTLESVTHDLFELGIGAIAMFVKNQNHLQTAGNIAVILKSVFPFL